MPPTPSPTPPTSQRSRSAESAAQTEDQGGHVDDFGDPEPEPGVISEMIAG